MKKFLSIILSVLIIGLAFSACSSESDETESENTDVSASTVIETEKAVIKESDAINFIKNSYTDEELGLSDVENDYSLMVAENGVEIEGKNYIKVAANVMTQSDVTTDGGKPTYNFTAVGEYYISFDGKTVLMKDMNTGEYKELENRYEDYKSKGETTAPEQNESDENTSEEE